MKQVENHIYYNALFDIYGELLNEREKEIFTLSSIEDLSLQEIADIKEVSKTAIGKILKLIEEETLKEKIQKELN